MKRCVFVTAGAVILTQTILPCKGQDDGESSAALLQMNSNSLGRWRLPCFDTTMWKNHHGYFCFHYSLKGWCANGNVAAGQEWTSGSQNNFPEDNCCVCGKAGTDCEGTLNGDKVVDQCGVCGGDASTCKEDCWGSEVLDECGVCDGDNSTCRDCEGIPNGGKVVDECGVCGGDDSTCKGIAICQDTAGWSNLHGNGCWQYANKGWCANGNVAAGQEWTTGSQFNVPEANCCVCGKDGSVTATCQDTAGWKNRDGYGCGQYASKGWCANGNVDPWETWTSGSRYNFPEDNCCICGAKTKRILRQDKYVKLGEGIAGPREIWLGKGKGFSACYEAVMADTRCIKDYFTYVSRGDKNCGCKGEAGDFRVRKDNNGDYFKIKSQTPAPAPAGCQDTEGWNNHHGFVCSQYASKGWCANGNAAAGQEWTIGSQFNFPEDNCCVCGKDGSVTAACQDTAGWHNHHGYVCGQYASKGWCANGNAAAGQEWTLGSRFNFPEDHCCVCGATIKRSLAQTPAQTPAPPPEPTPAPTPAPA